MREEEIKSLVEDVRNGGLSRRDFVKTMMAWGLTVPVAGHILADAGVAMAGHQPDYRPTQRGGGGPLKLLWWQAPTVLNPHFAIGTKDISACRIFYEPLAAWGPDATLVPILAAEIPSVENGGVAKDGKSVTWKLKQGVKWHDGRPFTADDCVFNWQFATNKEVASATIGAYAGVAVSKIDDHTIRVDYDKPTPFWAVAFVGESGLVVPKHLFEEYNGANGREAPGNLTPVGTGPYVFESFSPGEIIKGKLNGDYHEDNRPYFDTIEMKGGGDTASAARAVLQTGEYDYAWNTLIEDSLLKQLEKGGMGRASITSTGEVEIIALNFTDPRKEVDGERSSLKTKHPFLSDRKVRQAMNMLVDRGSIEKHIWGRAGKATANVLNSPDKFVSKNTSYEFNIDKATALLDEAGWKVGSDGVREKDGVKIEVVFQASVNGLRQKMQAVIKQAFEKAGISTELKSTPGSVFFSDDQGNPDTFTKFYADLEIHAPGMSVPDPVYLMRLFKADAIPTKANSWQGLNVGRWNNPEYDKLYDEAMAELDPVKRATIFIGMNEMLVDEVVVLPIVTRARVASMANNLYAPVSIWDNDLWSLKDWHRTP